MLKINVTKKKMKIKKIALVMAIVTVLGVFGGWTWKMPNFLLKFKPVKMDLIEKKLPEKRNVNIDRNNKISGEALQKFTETTFAEVLKEKKNMVYSPISLYVALSMLTESSQDNPVLLKLLSGKSVENIRNINKEILSEQYKGKNGTTVFANSNWIRKGNEPYKSLINNLTSIYQAQMFMVDFYNTEDVKNKMIKWINQNTEGLIKNIDPVVDRNFEYVLINTIYMKNSFISKFVKSDKKTMVFSDINKKKTQIPYLYNSISDPLRYYSGLKYEMAEKNLDAGYSIVFVKPENSLNDILNREAMKDIMTKLNGNNSGSYKMTNVKIPYIDTQSKIDMKKVLSNIGFEGIFDPAVSEYKVFKNIRNLKVSDILQEARFKMNESGIEAAAYTEIGMVKTALPEEAKKQLDFDKPFMYFVKDDGGNIYFVGTYVNYEGK